MTRLKRYGRAAFVLLVLMLAVIIGAFAASKLKDAHATPQATPQGELIGRIDTPGADDVRIYRVYTPTGCWTVAHAHAGVDAEPCQASGTQDLFRHDR